MHENVLEAQRSQLQQTRHRHAPYRCPITAPVPEGYRCQKIPYRLRATLAAIVSERAKANKLHAYGPPYYKVASIVEQQHSWLLHELRAQFGLSDTTIIGFSRCWTFHTITAEELQAAFDSIPKPKQQQEGSPTGPSDHMYRDKPPEKCHLFAYYARRQLDQGTLTQYLQKCREENKLRRGL